MRVPRYWAQGQIEAADQAGDRHSFSCWGWSDADVDDARRKGEERAYRVAQLFLAGEARGRYGYGDRPMREEILEELNPAGQKVSALITRNSYGCRVLNTEDAMFVDIDLPEPKSGGLFKSLFGKPQAPSPSPFETQALAKVELVAREDREMGIRIYRTKAGLRLLMTHAPLDPKAKETQALMESFGADPLYMNLCRLQECFRARLTPKPWRCGVGACTVTYPRQNEKVEGYFRRWEDKYTAAAERFATCRFLRHIGNHIVHEDIDPIVKFHDHATRANAGLSLA